jgi:hypothetical protein
LTAIDSRGAGFKSFVWNTGDISQGIFVDSVAMYSVTVTDMQDCLGSTSADVTAEGDVPLVPGEISGPTVVTIGTKEYSKYSVQPVANTSYYLWKAPLGATIVEFSDSSSIVLDFDAFSSGILEVAAGNNCGLSPSIHPRFISINSGVGNQLDTCTVPAVPGVIFGPDPVAGNPGLVKYSIMPVANSLFYDWTVPDGVTIVGSDCDSEIVLSIPTSTEGLIHVAAANECGSSPSLHPQTIQIGQ